MSIKPLFKPIWLISIASAAAVSAVASLASGSSAYETGFGPVSLAAATQAVDALSCSVSNAPARIVLPDWPEYPQIPLEEDVEGFSLVAFTLDLNGNVSDVRLASSSGNVLLDRAAVDAVRQSRFAPAISNCAKIAGSYDMPIVFSNH
jgi:TonB family protein